VLALSFAFRIYHYEAPYKLYFHSFSAAFDLSAGGLAAWLCLYNKKFLRFFSDLLNHWRILFACAGLLLMYLAVVYDKGLLAVFLRGLQVFFFAFIIIDQCFNVFGSGKLARATWLSRLGKYTYGIYLLHPICLLVFNTFSIRVLHLPHDSTYALMIAFFIGLPLTILAAKISYHFMEKKFL
jgi:peptidoglycan/LPS O-acetylase OafA/YrhL